jgi:hypothetical protein
VPDIEFNQFDGGLFLAGRKDRMPEGTLRRNKGLHPDSTTTMQSRNGSMFVKNLNAHSLFEFNDLRFAGATTAFYRDGVSVKTGLTGDRLRFAKMPPTLGVADSLFVAGGGDLFKIDSSGTVSQWGIDAPTTDLVAAIGVAGVLTGDYQYKITFTNTSTGTRSNANPNAASVTLSSDKADLSSIPTSSDTQVDAREIWRTTAGGTGFFLLATIADNVTTIFTDNIPDSALSGTELPIDNDPPLDTYNGCVGPHDGRAWWFNINIAGQRGRVIYSQAGRMEAVDGFIDVSSDDDTINPAIPWNGTLYCFTPTQVFQVAGSGTEEVFTVRGIEGVPGTTQPFTVVPTSNGIIYQGQSSLRIFNGVKSDLLNIAPIEGIFRGETLEDITGFTGVIATVTETEYIISDTTITLAYNLQKGTWRNVGVGVNGLFYERETGSLQATIESKIQLLENTGSVLDDTTPIDIEWEIPSITASVDRDAIIQNIYIETNTQNETLTPTVFIDETSTVLPILKTASRRIMQYKILKPGNRLGLRITGSVSKRVEVFRIFYDIYIPRSTDVPLQQQ